MRPALRAACSAIIIMAGLAILWLAKALHDAGVDSFSSGFHAFVDAMTTGWF